LVEQDFGASLDVATRITLYRDPDAGWLREEKPKGRRMQWLTLESTASVPADQAFLRLSQWRLCDAGLTSLRRRAAA
jgi:hypothetical protein